MDEKALKKLSDDELLSLAMKLKANNDIAERINLAGERVTKMAETGLYDLAVLDSVHLDLMDLDTDDEETNALRDTIFEGIAAIRKMLKTMG